MRAAEVGNARRRVGHIAIDQHPAIDRPTGDECSVHGDPPWVGNRPESPQAMPGCRVEGVYAAVGRADQGPIVHNRGRKGDRTAGIRGYLLHAVGRAQCVHRAGRIGHPYPAAGSHRGGQFQLGRKWLHPAELDLLGDRGPGNRRALGVGPIGRPIGGREGKGLWCRPPAGFCQGRRDARTTSICHPGLAGWRVEGFQAIGFAGGLIEAEIARRAAGNQAEKL